MEPDLRLAKELAIHAAREAVGTLERIAKTAPSEQEASMILDLGIVLLANIASDYLSRVGIAGLTEEFHGKETRI